jgi:hypothetical protein
MMRVTVPLPSGRAATVEGRTVTELSIALYTLGWPFDPADQPREMTRDEMEYLNTRLRHADEIHTILKAHDGDCSLGIGVEGLNLDTPGMVEDPKGTVYDSD